MLDFKDIQGNILLGYRSFWKARFLYFKFKTGPEGAKLGRDFLTALLDQRLITPADWGKNKPDAATNVAISMAGLRALQLNSETLASFPGEFQEGMRARADDLGDIGESHPEKWDQPWRSNDVHLLLMCYSDRARHIEFQMQGSRGSGRRACSTSCNPPRTPASS